MYNHITAMYLNLKDLSSVFVLFFFFKYKHCILANKYSILHIPNVIQYSKHKIQTAQGNPELIFTTLVFFCLSFYLKNFECENIGKNFSQVLL